MKFKLLPLFLALIGITFLFTSCTKDNDLTAEIVGTYIGTFVESIGSNYPEVEIIIEKASKTEVDVEMILIAGFPSIAFTAVMEDETNFNIPVFENKNSGWMMFGSGTLENSTTLKIELQREDDADYVGNFEGEKQ